jgi:coenzyme PQQ precursor peptide PqqA
LTLACIAGAVSIRRAHLWLRAYSKRFSQRRLPVNKDEKETTMAWTTPTLVEICIGLEINGYLPAEF